MLRILIVDDHADNRYLLRSLLGGNGYEIIEANHGALALSKARATPPDLIISDLLMPVMDGYSLLRQWKADENLKHIPFVVYTATYTEPDDEKLALDLGSDAFIIKPTEPDLFLKRIREVLAKVKQNVFTPPQAPVAEEKVYLKRYNRVLIHKLEKKLFDFERKQAQLQVEIAERQAAEEKEKLYFHRLTNVLESMIDGFIDIDANWVFRYINPSGARMMGRGPEDLIGKNFWAEFPEAKKSPLGQLYTQALETGEQVILDEIFTPWNRWFENRIYPSKDGLTIFFTDITERKHLEMLSAGRSAVLNKIAIGAPLSESMNELLIHIENLVPGILGSVMLLDSSGSQLIHCAAPSLPVDYCQAINGASIGPNAGSCGAAAFLGKPVNVDNISTDPLWKDYRDIALVNGLKACWSTPIYDNEGVILGTFAIYYREPMSPDDHTIELVKISTDLAAIAITGDKLATNLKESEEGLRLALDSAKMGSFDWNIPKDRITWSRWHEELWGFRPGEFGGTYASFLNRIHVDDQKLVNDEVERCKASQQGLALDFRVVWSDGSVHWVHARGEFSFNNDGNPDRMRGIVTGITDRKVAEDKLKNLAQRLIKAQQTAHLGFVDWNIKTNELFMSDEGYRLHGIDAQSQPLTVEAVIEAVHPDDAKLVETSLQNALKGVKPYDIEHRIIRPDGTAIWVSAKAELILDAQGSPDSLLGTIHDITDRIEAQYEREKLLESERRSRLEAEILKDANLAITHDLDLENILTELLDYLRLLVPYDSGNVLLWKDETHLAVNALRGYSAFTNAKDTRVIEFDVTSHPVFISILKNKRTLTVADTREFPGWERPAGAEHVISWMGVPLVAGGNVLGIYSVDKTTPNFFTEEHGRLAEALSAQGAAAIQNALLHKQVSDHAKELEGRVAERTSELAAVNKELEAFSYSISHDLRAPLRHISGFSQALLAEYGDKFDDNGKKYLNHLGDASKEMAQLIDDVLQLARVTRGEMHRKEIDLSELVSETLHQLQTLEPDRIVDITVEPGLKAFGDQRLLGIVISNLLENAWKFSSKKKRAKIAFGNSISNDELVYFVRDNGAGFDMEYADKLFGAFQRMHAAHEFEGTGIGLASAHRIISRHGGRVWAKSAVGKGTTIYFSLLKKGTALDEK